jgi:hypothetical protein
MDLVCKTESGNKKWTSSETNNLISESEESPCLCNVFEKDCKNKDMKLKENYIISGISTPAN